MKIVQTITFDVPSDFEGWTTAALVLRPGEELRVRASGMIDHGSGHFAFPEGRYDDDTDPDPTYDPDACTDYIGDPADFLVSNTKPQCLNFVPTVVGASAPSTAGDLDGLRPTRDHTYTYEDLATFLSISGGEHIKCWFSQNDGVGGFGNNTGSFLVTLTRYAQGASTVSLNSLVRAQVTPLSIAAPETPVDADRLPISWEAFEPDPQLIADNLKVAGSFGDRGVVPQEEWANFTVRWRPDYIESPWWHSGVFCTPSYVGTGNGSLVYGGLTLPVGVSVYVYRPFSKKANETQVFGADYGVEENDPSDNIVLQCTRMELASMTLKTKRSGGTGNISGSLSGFMRKPENLDEGNLFAAADAVWTVTLVGGPTSGHAEFTNENGQKWQIQFDDTNSEADTAMEVVFGVGNVAVGRTGSGSAGSPYVYTITFGGDLAGQNIPLPSIVSTLAGGTTPSVGFVEATKGGPLEYDIVPVRGPECTVWLGTSRGALYDVDGSDLPDGVVMSDEFETNFNFTGRRKPYFVENRAYGSYKASAEVGTDDGRTEEITVKMAVGPEMLRLWQAWRDNENQFLGFQAKSSREIGSTGIFYEYRITCKVAIVGTPKFSNNEGIWTVEFTLKVVEDQDYGGYGPELVYITDTEDDDYKVA